MPAPRSRFETAADLVKRKYVETRSTSIIDNAVAFLGAIETHRDQERLQGEIVDNWYRAFHRGNFRDEPSRQLQEKMSDWYLRRWSVSLGRGKPMTRKKLITEINKWFWLQHYRVICEENIAD